jgi:S1-C subfamily serine protease
MKQWMLGLAFVLGSVIYVGASPNISIRPLWLVEQADVPHSQICTTSSINGKIGLWLTANHCVQNGPVEVEDRSDPDHPFYPATVIWQNGMEDLAVLITPGLRVTALKLATVSPEVGDEVHSFGFPLAFTKLQFVRGYMVSDSTKVSDEGQIRDLFNLSICAGASGSPILNKDGDIVSVVQLGFGTKPCAPIAGGTAFQTTHQLLERFFE